MKKWILSVLKKNPKLKEMFSDKKLKQQWQSAAKNKRIDENKTQSEISETMAAKSKILVEKGKKAVEFTKYAKNKTMEEVVPMAKMRSKATVKVIGKKINAVKSTAMAKITAIRSRLRKVVAMVVTMLFVGTITGIFIKTIIEVGVQSAVAGTQNAAKNAISKKSEESKNKEKEKDS